MTLTELYAYKNRINAKLDADDCSPIETDDLLRELDACCDRIDALEALRYADLCPCNF